MTGADRQRWQDGRGSRGAGSGGAWLAWLLVVGMGVAMGVAWRAPHADGGAIEILPPPSQASAQAGSQSGPRRLFEQRVGAAVEVYLRHAAGGADQRTTTSVGGDLMLVNSTAARVNGDLRGVDDLGLVIATDRDMVFVPMQSVAAVRFR